MMIKICKNCPKLEELNVHSQSLTNDAAINGVSWLVVNEAMFMLAYELFN